VFALTGAAVLGARTDEPDVTPLAAVVLLVQCAPLLWRRRYPVGVWAVTGLAGMVYGLADWPDPVFALGSLIALATVVECCARPTAVLVWCASVGAAATGLTMSGDSDAIDVWIAVVSLSFAPLIGDRQRARNAYTAQLEEAARLQEAEQLRAIRDARDAERSHLARELHDVVAHHVSMMVVQAEAGAAQADRTEAATVLDEVADTGRRALGELRTMLEVMDDGEQGAPTRPQPGIEDIPGLVEHVRGSGLSVELKVTGDCRDVPPAVSLSAYRIVQEGLTNVMKHARNASTRIGVNHHPGDIEITVTNDGDPAAGRPEPRSASTSAGRGLHGLRERVELLHGRFDATPRRGGGFEIRAVLPTRGPP
jgi:signal transduction histidine kinase